MNDEENSWKYKYLVPGTFDFGNNYLRTLDLQVKNNLIKKGYD